MDKFVKLVRDMREAQKAYFSDRTYDKLTVSKRLETEVDKMLKNYRSSGTASQYHFFEQKKEG